MSIKQKGGTVNNTGTVTGSDYGVYIYGAPGNVINSGSISATATGGFGVELLDGGSVTNDANADIYGSCGVYISGGGCDA